MLIVSLLGLAWFFLGVSVTRGAELRDILAKAKTVQVLEYASTALSATPTIYSEQLSAKTLSQSEVEKIIGSFSSLGIIDRGKACDFEPHHLLLCAMADGTVRKVHICFKCNDIRIDEGHPFDLLPWSKNLEFAFVECGVPIRPELYRSE